MSDLAQAFAKPELSIMSTVTADNFTKDDLRVYTARDIGFSLCLLAISTFVVGGLIKGDAHDTNMRRQVFHKGAEFIWTDDTNNHDLNA
jgi:hypothetical protein